MKPPRPWTPPPRHLPLPGAANEDIFFPTNNSRSDSKRARSLRASLDQFGPRSSALRQAQSSSPSDEFSDQLSIDSRPRSDDFSARDSASRWIEFESDNYLSASDDEILAEPTTTHQSRRSSELAPPLASLSHRSSSSPATSPPIAPPSTLPDPPPEPSQLIPVPIRKD